jgi:hypothetical protein
MKGVFRRNEKIVYFELMKLKFSKDERKNMRRIVVKQIKGMRMKGRMGQK